MPVDLDSGQYTPDDGATRTPAGAGHPLMPPPAVVRKAARIVIAANVVAFEVENGKRESPRMLRALAAMIRWGAEPDVVAWVQRMKDRGEIEEGFLR